MLGTGDMKICGLGIVPSMVGLYCKYLSFEVPTKIRLLRDAKLGWALSLPWESIL